jgi:hypothetical protein
LYGYCYFIYKTGRKPISKERAEIRDTNYKSAKTMPSTETDANNLNSRQHWPPTMLNNLAMETSARYIHRINHYHLPTVEVKARM